MNPLPLLSRELNVASRRTITQRLKLAFGGGSMLVAVWALLVSTGDAGHMIFVALSASVATLAMFTAIFVASDSISRERREGTLGFLFLTDLHAEDVVLGKLAAAGLVPAYTLLAMFPAFALCQLTGGVPAGLFWRTMLALVLSLFFSLSATLFVSSLCEDHRKAYTGSTVLLLLVSPGWLCVTALTARWSLFLLVALLFFFFSLFFLRSTATHLRKGWQDNPKVTRGNGARLPARIPTALLEAFPVAWMMLRRQHGSGLWRNIAFLLGSGAALICAPWATTAGGAERCLWGLFAIHLGYQFVLIARTSYSFYTDRQNGALELLLGSRLVNEEIFEGFNRFLFRKSAPVIAFLSAVDLGYAGLLWKAQGSGLAALPIALALGLWITLLGLGWLGVYRSLMMKHPSLAMLATYARLSFVPAVLSLLFLTVPRTDQAKVAIFYVLSSGFLAAFFSLDAKAALALHGRTLLLRPHTEKPPHIENEWSFIDWAEVNDMGEQELTSRSAGLLAGSG